MEEQSGDGGGGGGAEWSENSILNCRLGCHRSKGVGSLGQAQAVLSVAAAGIGLRERRRRGVAGRGGAERDGAGRGAVG